MATTEQSTSHPLEPLTDAGIHDAVAILRLAREIGDSYRLADRA